MENNKNRRGASPSSKYSSKPGVERRKNTAGHSGATQVVKKSASSKKPVSQRAEKRTEKRTEKRVEKSSKNRQSTQQASVNSYIANHKKVALESILRLLLNPLSGLMTWAVIGIALALPVGLSVLLSNLSHLSEEWNQGSQITLFLKLNTSEEAAFSLQQELTKRSAIESAELIRRDDALNDFKRLSGFGDVLNYLDENPLPHVIVVKPAESAQSMVQMDGLKERLEMLPLVDQIQLDLQWVQRLYSITELLQRSVWAIAFLLALAVLLVIGNTVRLAIENRREEIVVVKMVGGTDSFVRRPFLYSGVWFGLGGGIIAFILVDVTLLWLDGAVQELASLYGSNFSLSLLGIESTLFLLIISMLLGWCGAWLAVRRHLDEIEPS